MPLSVVTEVGGTAPMELSVVNSGEELSISVEKVEVLEVWWYSQPYWPSSQTLALEEAVVTAPELSVVNSGEELSISVEKVEVLEVLWYSHPYWPSSQMLTVVDEAVVPGPAELSVVNSGEELST